MYDQWRRLHLAWYRIVAYKRDVRAWLSVPANRELAISSGWADVIAKEGSAKSLPLHTAQVLMGIDDATDIRFRARFQLERKGTNV